MTLSLQHIHVWLTSTKLYIISSKHTRSVIYTDVTGEVTLVYPFSKDYRKGITTLNNGKADAIDDVLVKQINNVGPTLHNWIIDMLNNASQKTRYQESGDNQ